MTAADAPVMLIMGGSGAIGGEIAAQAVSAGWRVALHGRSEAKIAEIAARLNAGVPDAVKGFQADIFAPDAVEHLVEDVGGQFGRIDAVIDSVAGGPSGGRIVGAFKDTEPSAYAPFATASFVHTQRLAHAALPWLSRQGGTFIAFISDAGKFAAPKQTMIGAARAGTIGFIRNLAVEVARDGVRAHCISPSFVEKTDALNRGGALGENSRIEKARARAGLGLPTVADIAPVAVFLCGDGAKRITGQIISINGGLNA